MRARLEALDPEELVEALRCLVRVAQTGEGTRPDSSRALIEAVRVSNDAARARQCVAEGKPVPVRWLAALGSVTPTRIRQLLRDGVLRRDGSHVELASARTWLGGITPASAARVRSLSGRRLVLVKPSWWDNRNWTNYFHFELSQRVQPLMPPGYELRFDFRDNPYFEVPAGAMSQDEVEEWRTLVRDALEPFNPDEGGWTFEGKVPIHW